MSVDSATLSPSSARPVTPAPTGPLEGVRAGNENLVRLTESAGKKVGALAAREKKGELLRVAISGGGCNGLSYKLRFTPDAKRGDILVRTGGVNVLVDPKTALYLKGTVLDYSHQMGGVGSSSPIRMPKRAARVARVLAFDCI